MNLDIPPLISYSQVSCSSPSPQRPGEFELEKLHIWGNWAQQEKGWDWNQGIKWKFGISRSRIFFPENLSLMKLNSHREGAADTHSGRGSNSTPGLPLIMPQPSSLSYGIYPCGSARPFGDTPAHETATWVTGYLRKASHRKYTKTKKQIDTWIKRKKRQETRPRSHQIIIMLLARKGILSLRKD